MRTFDRLLAETAYRGGFDDGQLDAVITHASQPGQEPLRCLLLRLLPDPSDRRKLLDGRTAVRAPHLTSVLSNAAVTVDDLHYLLDQVDAGVAGYRDRGPLLHSCITLICDRPQLATRTLADRLYAATADLPIVTRMAALETPLPYVSDPLDSPLPVRRTAPATAQTTTRWTAVQLTTGSFLSI